MNGWNGCDLGGAALASAIGMVILLFSVLFGGNSLWMVMPVVEIVVLFISVMFLKFSQTSEYSERIQKMK
ncbi:MAG: hypothetical protein ACLTZ1_06090 [Blautia sp.]|jgi:uncharacterized membrane protein|uniref:hypothetical protein n=1 Tax=unclassified Blautia TaxID=2648079 RepID=UPI001572106C|nr:MULTISPECIES: hypothetical protein [unclassified Blautia]MBT9840552.1 hypothetical protein [Blautia sp. MCC283]NSY28232.1 hypothetical protein [Blautia sp. MSK.20.85]